MRMKLILLLLVLLPMGCMRIGPDMLHKDRFDYTAAVGDSWKEQVLLNIVRLRYSDWPAFVAVDQIVTSYTLEHTGTAKGTLRTFSAQNQTNDQIEAGWVGKYNERPTILFKPLSGQKYVNALLTPAKPVSILALMESGWPADHLGRIAFRSVNGYYNTNAEYGVMHRTDKEFAQFINSIRLLQQADALKVRITKEEEKEFVALRIFPEKLSVSYRADVKEMKKALGLKDEVNIFRIRRSSIIDSDEELRIQGRSLLQVLVALSTGVIIPQDHLEENIAPPLEPIPEVDTTDLKPLMVVQSGEANPGDSFVAVKYLDKWFWIDKTDHFSKRSLQYALTLITLLDSDDKAGGTVVIPVN